MKPIRVNANYEQELFKGSKGSWHINHSLEFLAFYLTSRSVYTQKKYSPEYLDYVEEITGRRPKLQAAGVFENWWGALTNLPFERWMNSKITSTELIQAEGWGPVCIIQSPDDKIAIHPQITYLQKDPFGMSGHGMKVIKSREDIDFRGSFPFILEPLLQRVYDFSTYVYPDGKHIIYQNIVDEKFQYKGTLISSLEHTQKESLSFYSKISFQEWEKFHKRLERIKSRYTDTHLDCGFSIDSFVYKNDFAGELSIWPVCEVNYRRTMGLVTYELLQLFSTYHSWGMLVLAKMKSVDFLGLIKAVKKLDRVIVLSPPDVRFQFFLLLAADEVEGKALLRELQHLLPHAQFAVNIE